MGRRRKTEEEEGKAEEKQISPNQISTETSERTKDAEVGPGPQKMEVVLQKISHILDEKAFTGEGGETGSLPTVRGQLLPRWAEESLRLTANRRAVKREPDAVKITQRNTLRLQRHASGCRACWRDGLARVLKRPHKTPVRRRVGGETEPVTIKHTGPFQSAPTPAQPHGGPRRGSG